jgi:gliding motility-associated-like protein
MKNLGGQTNVKFRFTFGAGTSCNNYDGFAFDLIKISQAPRFTSNFNLLCQSPGTFKFSDASSNCPTTWKWNFGDGTSSTAQNPFHTYASPGLYPAQLIASNSCATPDTFQNTLSFLGVLVTPYSVGCSGGNVGSAKVKVIGQNPNLPISYYWNTNPPQNTDSAISLAPGTYSVTVSQPNTCPITKTFSISGTPGLSHSIQLDSAFCQSASGQLSIQMSGGVPPYSYQWTPSLSSGPSASGITPGPISILVRDASGCKDSISLNFPSKTYDYQTWINQFKINVITPNQDGFNDDFYVFDGQPAPEKYELEIFNRWGNSVFKSTDPTEKWNGKWNQSALPDGSYFYSLRFESCQKNYSKSGFIQIVR